MNEKTESLLHEVDPSIVRGLLQRRVSRRDLFKGAAGATGLAALLAACGTPGTAPQAGQKLPNAGLGTSAWWDKQKKTGALDFANWPFYIDTYHGTHPSLETFTKDTGINVKYFEVIQDNAEFYAKVRPALQAGQTTGYDLMVLTNNSPVFGFILNAGWVIPLDHRQMVNFNKYASPLVKNPAWDPGNKYSMAWQSGYTVMGYNTKAIKRPITSVNDLFDPAFKGKVGMFSDLAELGSAGLLAIGVTPATSTPDDWKKAAAKLMQQRDAGIVRNYYDQSYIKALEDGDLLISQVWSGDVFQANLNGYHELKALMPKEGGMFWTDNMMIPYTAQHPEDAMTYMDFVYRPDVQAVIENYNNYVSPVPDAKSIIANKLNNAVVANSPWVFPTSAFDQLTRTYYQYKSQQDLDEWNGIFQPIVQA